MFTGIIEATAKVQKMTSLGLVLERPKNFDDIKIGSSIAVSGVCLSVVAFDKKSVSFDVVPTTFSKTKLGSLKIGSEVNLERAMKADGRFEGHIVTGHVEGVGIVHAPTGSFSPGVPSSACALSPNPSPVPGEGNVAQNLHVWKGVSGLTYAPSSVVSNARAMRKKPTPAEQKLWTELRRKKMSGYYFRRQRPIGSCIVDFYCEALRLAIEVDGDIHDEENQKAYDEWRDEHLRLRGVRFLRFSNENVMRRMDEVLKKIEQWQSAPLPPEGGGAGGGGTNEDGILSPVSIAGGGGTKVERSDPEILGEGLWVGATDGEAAGGGGTKEDGILNPVLIAGGGMNERAATTLTISLPASALPFILLHGSITIDGVSLTVADVKGPQITVAIIPHTLVSTTLGSLAQGDKVNIETDILGKYILQAHGSHRGSHLRQCDRRS